MSGRTCLGVDKAYNLGNVLETVTVYKHLLVTRQVTEGNPIFIGPILLHGHSTEKAFQPFFSALAAEFKGMDLTKLVLCSDDEAALRNAMKQPSPAAPK